MVAKIPQTVEYLRVARPFRLFGEFALCYRQHVFIFGLVIIWRIPAKQLLNNARTIVIVENIEY